MQAATDLGTAAVRGGLLCKLQLGAYVWMPSNHDRPSWDPGTLSAPQEGGRFSTPTFESLLTHDTGMENICVHTTWPIPPF